MVTRKKKAQKPRLAGYGEGSATSGGKLEAQDRRDSKRKASVYVDNPKIGTADKTTTSIQKRQSARRSETTQGSKAIRLDCSFVGAGGKKAVLRSFNFGSRSGLGAELKKGQPGPTKHNKGIGISRDSLVFRFGSSASSKDHGEYTREVGDILQKESYPNRGHNDQHDQEGFNKNHGVVRMGVDVGLEKPFSTDSVEPQDELSPPYRQSMELDTKSVVEVPNG